MMTPSLGLTDDENMDEDHMTADFSPRKWAQTVSFAALSVCLGCTAYADRKSPAPISFSDNISTRGHAVTSWTAPEMSTSPLFQTGTQPAELAGAPLEANARTRRVEFRYPHRLDTDNSAHGALTQRGNAEAPITPSQPIRIAALTSTLPQDTHRPLTLSTVTPLRDTPVSEERGSAGLYGDGFDGQPTANGEIYNALALTAAHRTLPLPSLVHVTNVETQKDIVVRVNDRGPFNDDKILELSPRAGAMLGIGADQTATINLRYLGPAPVKTVENYANRTVEAESLPAIQLTRATPPGPERVAASPPHPADAEPYPINASGVFVQVGSFSDISNAQKMFTRIKPFHPVTIEPARVHGSDYFRVIVGPFSNRREADHHRQQMAYDGLADGFVVRR